MSAILEQIENIVSKPSTERTDEEISSVLHWFRKKSDIFQSLKLDAITDIIRNSALIKRQGDNLIIKQGDRGDCFFIILNGKVSIYISTKEEDEVDEDPETVSRPASRSSSISSIATESAVPLEETTGTGRLRNKVSSSEMFPRITQSLKSRVSLETVLEAFQLTTSYSQPTPLDRTRFGQYIVSLDDGKSFGELALIRKECIRNATIITDRPTQLLVINRQLYNRCIKESQAKEFASKMKFVKKSEYFTGWSARYKKLLAMSLKSATYSFGMTLVCQGQPVDKLIFLTSGQCRVVIDASRFKTQYPDLIKKEDNSSNEPLEKLYNEYIPPPQSRLRRVRKGSAAIKGYDICIIGNRNMIGDVELTTNLPTNLQSVICEQQAEAFILDLRNYERLITKRNPSTVKLIFSDAMLKLDNRAYRFKQIPFLRHLLEKSTGAISNKTKAATVTETSITDLKMSPVPFNGPLIDIYGKGSVFHYIRTRHEQLKKSSGKNFWQSSKFRAGLEPDAVAAIKSRTPENCEQREKTDRPRSSSSTSSNPHVTGLEKLHEFELERMNKLEERMIAWHVNVEATKLKAMTNSSITSEPRKPVTGYLTVAKMNPSTVLTTSTQEVDIT